MALPNGTGQQLSSGSKAECHRVPCPPGESLLALTSPTEHPAPPISPTEWPAPCPLKAQPRYPVQLLLILGHLLQDLGQVLDVGLEGGGGDIPAAPSAWSPLQGRGSRAGHSGHAWLRLRLDLPFPGQLERDGSPATRAPLKV